MITLAEAAKLLGVSVRRLNALCAQGRIPRAKKLGNMWVLPDHPTIKPGKRGPKLGSYK